MSEVIMTPRTDAEAESVGMGYLCDDIRGIYVTSHFARGLETELNKANERLKKLEGLLSEVSALAEEGDYRTILAMTHEFGRDDQ